jgi:hypothetical protein
MDGDACAPVPPARSHRHSLWAALNVGLGDAIGRSAVHVTQAITHYSLLLNLLLAVVVLAAAVLYVRRARTRPTLYEPPKRPTWAVSR